MKNGFASKNVCFLEIVFRNEKNQEMRRTLFFNF